MATTNSSRPRGALLGATHGYRGSPPLRARSRGATGVGNVEDRVQCFNGRGYGHMFGQCRSFNPRRDPYRDVVCATCGSYERDHVKVGCLPDLSRTRVFGVTTRVATQQPSTFQPSFSQAHNPSSNLPGNVTFAPSNVTQATTGNQQSERSASVPQQS